MKFGEKNGRKNYQNNYNDDKGSSSDAINTCSSGNCFSEEISWNRQSDKRRRWNKSTHTETEESNECSRTKWHGRRVKRRISRGVQTPEKKKKSSHVKRKIVNLFKFEWCSRKKCWKNDQKCSALASGETDPAETKSIELIHKPHEDSGRNDNFLDTKSNGATSDTNDKETREKPVQTNGNDNTAKKNYNRKYDFSVDGTNIEIVRTKKSGTTKENSELPKRFTHPPSGVHPEKKRANTRRKGRARSERNVEKATVVNEGESSVPDDGSSSQIDKRKGNKSKTHETVKRRDKVVNKTVRINESEELKSTNNRTFNSENRDGRPTAREIDKSVVHAIEEPETTGGPKGRSKETKNPSTFKSLTKGVQKSFAPRRPQNEKSRDEGQRNNVPGSEPIGKQMDARRNEIADVKKRLDACIADLNDIIFNLSEVFQGIPAPGSGPAGEGTSPENINRSRRGRSRVRL